LRSARLPKLAIVLCQPTAQDRDRWKELVAAQHHQVNVVGLLAAAKTMSQIVLRIHCRSQFAAMVLTAVENCSARRVKRGGPKLQRAVSYFV
jgi:hypothetical protein